MRAATARPIDMSDVERGSYPAGMVEQGIQIRQRKAAPDEESGQEKRGEAVRPTTCHAASLEWRPDFVYGPITTTRLGARGGPWNG
jgi:hypothetical protein